MTKHEDQEKQLDSVTDVVQEQEVDATKAQEAMSALSANQQQNALSAADQVAVAKEDVDLIVSELEISEELAERTLREVALEISEGNASDSMVVAALRKLVVS
jgi:HYPK UBA domain